MQCQNNCSATQFDLTVLIRTKQTPQLWVRGKNKSLLSLVIQQLLM